MKPFIFHKGVCSIIFSIIFVLIQVLRSYADDPTGTYEIWIKNMSVTDYALIQFYPVGTIFNGGNETPKITTYCLVDKYTPLLYRRNNTGPVLKYITGLDGYAIDGRSGGHPGWFVLYRRGQGYGIYNDWCFLGCESTFNDAGNDGIFGYGRYRLDIFDIGEHLKVSIPIDWGDFNYPYLDPGAKDLIINIYDINSNPPTITYEWQTTNYKTEISVFDNALPTEDRGNIKVYKQYFYKDENYPPKWYGHFVTPSFGNSISEQNWLNYPLDATDLPTADQGYESNAHSTPGSLYRNLTIFTTHSPYINSYDTFKVEENADLKFQSNSVCTINPFGKMFNYGTIDMSSTTGSLIYVKVGGKFCNYGILKNVRIYWEHGLHSICNAPFSVTGGTIYLKDSAFLQIPENSNLTLDSNSTLVMNPYSQLQFGQNSKLIIKNGSHLVADHATFTSLDAGNTWDGIYLEGISNDTLKNCTIENASNGINIINKSGTGLNQPSTEISNCTFSNTTTTQLANGIYASNSNNVLIRNNTFASSQLASGFATGIWLEYCPSGNFDIIDNNINYVTTGITTIQSSPYIARNTITGQLGIGNGMYFDNSNGTGKYNWVYNFKKSLYGSYSSPYLLKNTFSGASDTAIDLVKSSVPVLRPINSGSTLSWLGGNNLITGSPLYAGIVMRDDAYPSMDSGYNKINVGTVPYISGTVPQVLAGLLPVKYNYWTDQPPNPSQFVLQDGIAVYDPTFDGTTLPPTNYYNLNDIGFGLFDTVYVENLGDSPGAEQLFTQAYQNEVQGHYGQAILLYKQVVQYYITSDYASISLSRIFNCLEKNRSIITDYQQLQTYMNQLNINSNYSSGIRELALDFMIKSKVRQGLIASAINDYDQIYQHNLNNAKGQHALINKLCLMVMLSNGGDNPNGQQSYEKVKEHKNNMLSLINGGKVNPLKLTVNSTVPKQYKLYQNYPNPFNPTTTIKYDIPAPPVLPEGEVHVRLVIYDLLGREVAALVNQEMKPGSYEVKFDGSNYASGLYFYRLEAGSYVEVKKMVLIK